MPRSGALDNIDGYFNGDWSVRRYRPWRLLAAWRVQGALPQTYHERARFVFMRIRSYGKDRTLKRLLAVHSGVELLLPHRNGFCSKAQGRKNEALARQAA